MKKIGRVLLFLVGGIVALFALALLAVNLYVQSQSTQARIQDELSRRLGATLHIRRISVTPWWGLKLTGITMPQSEARMTGDFLNAETFRLRIRFSSLFTGNLIINEVALVRPTVRWAQNADGKWRLPSMPQPVADVRANESPRGSNVPGSEATSEGPFPEEQIAQPERSTFTPEVRRVSLTNGSFHFVDSRSRPVAAFDGVMFKSNFRSTAELRGNATIRKISLRDRFFLQELKSPLRYDADELELPQIRAQVGGGTITGKFHMLQTERGSPFVADVSFRDVQVDRVVSDAGGPAGMLHGRIEGKLNATGKTADPNALNGAGEIYLHEGEVRRYDLLVALGQLLQLPELERLQLDQAQAKYHITPGVVSIDELFIHSPNIRLSATGTVSFTGKLRLDSQLAINEKVRDQLFRAVRNNFQAMPEQPGYSAVKFEVTGTIERPKTNLMGKLIGPELKDLGGLISTFLGAPKAAKAADEQPSESPTPSPSP